jgi:hypothetical protein
LVPSIKSMFCVAFIVALQHHAFIVATSFLH